MNSKYHKRDAFHITINLTVVTKRKIYMRTPRAVAWPTVRSNKNEVIRAIRNFFTKRFHTHKTHISKQKQKKAAFFAHKKHLRGRKSLIRLFSFLYFLCFFVLFVLFLGGVFVPFVLFVLFVLLLGCVLVLFVHFVRVKFFW